MVDLLVAADRRADKMDPRLLDYLAAAERRALAAPGLSLEGETVDVVISPRAEVVPRELGSDVEAGEALRALRAQAANAHGDVVEALRTIDRAPATAYALTAAVPAKLTVEEIMRLAQREEVRLIRLGTAEQVTCMHESGLILEASDVRWRGRQMTGRGVRVALLDSGADETHPALSGIVEGVSTCGESIDVPGAHGTHTAGSIISSDPVYRGVAPGASLINVKVLTAAGMGTPQAVIQGLEEAILRGARVASLSLGWSEMGGWLCHDGDCILCVAADNAVALGLTVVVAAGNEGSMSGQPPFAIRHPGAARKVITVGAVDKAKVPAAFSSVGPSSARLSPGSSYRYCKPEVLAPGVDVISTLPGSTFGSMVGTSMATPQVAGIAALVLQAHPRLSPAEVRKQIELSCQPLDGELNRVGYGVVNAFGSVLART